jgi:hypothetical protein
MTITSRLTQKDFINANLVLLYSRIFVKIMTGIILLIFLSGIALEISGKNRSGIQPILTPFIILTVLPVSTYFAAKKNFNSDKRIGEQIEYTFNREDLFVKGESFHAQLSIEKIFKVTQTKNWLLVWQSKQIANVIPKEQHRRHSSTS